MVGKIVKRHDLDYISSYDYNEDLNHNFYTNTIFKDLFDYSEYEYNDKEHLMSYYNDIIDLRDKSKFSNYFCIEVIYHDKYTNYIRNKVYNIFHIGFHVIDELYTYTDDKIISITYYNGENYYCN